MKGRGSSVDAASPSPAPLLLLDEWEWPADCEAQREMETHLRCQICGDFFHGPVLLPCSHTFCSACVRRFLQSKGAHGCCPQCKQPCTPRELVANRALEHVTLLFEKNKPALLQRLQGMSATTSTTSTPSTESGARPRRSAGTSGKATEKLERMPLVSYSLMRDKEVRKLLDAISVRVSTKNREEIIQIHKEFVLLVNAQADSCNPKSAAQLREEVTRNHHMRMQQKTKAEASKFISNASSGDTGGAGTASPATGVSVQMRANFEKLRQGIADRKAGKRPPTPTEPTPPVIPTGGDGESSAEEDAASVGVWRHFGALDTSTKQEFYVNSVTHEIRVQPPSPLVLELSPPNRYDDLDDIARAVADREGVVVDLSGDGETTTPVKTRAKAKRAIAPAFFSPDAASEFQSATEDLTVSDGAGQEEQVQVEAGNKRESLGKHARSDEDEVDEATTAGESIEVDANANDGDAAAIVDAVETADVASKWECSRCTLLNESTCPQCEACGYEPVAAPAKKRQRKKMHFQSKISLS